MHSDYVIEEKSATLQKRDSEGFGFVLRGAKGLKCTHAHESECNPQTAQML